MHGGALETETDNLRTAMEWGTTSEAGDPLVPFRLLRLIWSTEWSMRGRLGECREWARRLVGRLGATDQRGEYVRALGIEALIVWYQGDAEGALPLAEETLRCVEAAGDPDGARDSRHLLGVIYQSAARYEDARAIHAQDLAWLAEHDQGADHRFEVATSLYRLGRALSGLGEIREAEYRLTESLTLFLAEEDAEAKQGNARWGISRSLFLNRLALASAARHQGRWSEAGKHGIVGLPFLDDCPEPRLVAMGIEGIALLSAAFGETDTAARLWGAADQLREQCGSKRSADEAREYAPAYQAAQASGREAFALARAEGAALGRNGALHFARAFLERLTATDSANA